MALTIKAPETEPDLKPRIIVVGVGGAGGNAVNNMINSNLQGVEFIVANTDAQALKMSKAETAIQLGVNLTQGLGAGANPETGREAARESIDDIVSHLRGSHMVFITAGMGGGTGTGAAPVLAEACRNAGILTVGVVTKPFHFEGAQRMFAADAGIAELQKFVDTLIVIPNQNLFRIANEKTTFADAFRIADDVLYSGVRGVTELMVMPGLINLDFSDIRTVMGEMGKAMMGTGEAEGENRAIMAAEAAISNPLLEDLSMKGARGILVSITGSYDMTLFEVDEAANRIREEISSEANIIFGSTFDDTLEGRIRISVVATGIEAEGLAELRSRPAVTNSAPQKDSQTSEVPEAELPETALLLTEDAVTKDTVFEQGGEELQEVIREDTAEDTPHVSVEEKAVAPSLFANTHMEGKSGEQEEKEKAEDFVSVSEVVSNPVTSKDIQAPDVFIPPPALHPADDIKAKNDSVSLPTQEEKPAKEKSNFLSLIGLGNKKLSSNEEEALEMEKDTRSEGKKNQKTQDKVPSEQGFTFLTGADEEMLNIPAFLRRQVN